MTGSSSLPVASPFSNSRRLLTKSSTDELRSEARDDGLDALADQHDAVAIPARLLHQLATALVDALLQHVVVVLVGQLADAVLRHVPQRYVRGARGERTVVLREVAVEGRAQRQRADAERALGEALRVASEVGRGGQCTAVYQRALDAKKGCGRCDECDKIGVPLSG